MAGKGFDYYRSSYTHEQLWEMLVTQGDSWSVEQAGSVWTTASSGLASAREQLDASMLETIDYWQGPASEEFQRRMRLVYEYSQTAEEEMTEAAEVTIPDIAGFLTDAQGKAREQDLSPARELDYDDWLEEVKRVTPEDPDYLEKQEQYRSEYEQYKSERHDAIAQIVADLGDRYATYRDDRFPGPPAPPPSDMPGNSTYQPPTGGVFGNDGLNPGGAPLGPPGSDLSAGTDLNGDGVPDVEQVGLDDLDPVEGWDLGSYDNLDSDISGGLAGGGGLGPIGGGGYTGGTVSTGGMGGTTSMAGTGSGLFGPARGGGAGSAPGRGTGTTSSPARSGATRSTAPSNTRGGSSGSNRGMGPGSNSSGRGMSRGNGMGPRGGTRSGYYDDDEDEETTRETWLQEDDINWGGNRTPDEELDD